MEKMIDTHEITRLGEILPKTSRIVVTCHVRPDGDAIGSSLGIYHILKKLGKDVSVVIPDQAPRNLSFLPGFREMAIYTHHKEYCEELIGKAELIFCCDFNKPSRQGNLEPIVQASEARKVLLDHHQHPDDFAEINFSYPDMSSACEVVFRVLAAMGLYVDMDKDCATCLLTGMVTDTRNFAVNIKSPDIYDILSKLLSKGADKTMIVKEALETRSYWSLKLEAYAIAEKMTISAEHHAAITALDREELKRFNYKKGDTEGIVNTPLQIRGVVYSFFLRQDEECVKVSARSVKNFPVSAICEDLFGGGGHRMAAGAEFYGSLEECRAKLMSALSEYDKYLPRLLENIEI